MFVFFVCGVFFFFFFFFFFGGGGGVIFLLSLFFVLFLVGWYFRQFLHSATPVKPRNSK